MIFLTTAQTKKLNLNYILFGLFWNDFGIETFVKKLSGPTANIDFLLHKLIWRCIMVRCRCVAILFELNFLQNGVVWFGNLPNQKYLVFIIYPSIIIIPKKRSKRQIIGNNPRWIWWFFRSLWTKNWSCWGADSTQKCYDDGWRENDFINQVF